MNTRPHRCYSVGYVSRSMAKPIYEHWTAMKLMLRYVAGTVNCGVQFRKKQVQVPQLNGYSDSGMVGDINDRNSTTGMLFKLGDSLISWQSQKQKWWRCLRVKLSIELLQLLQDKACGFERPRTWLCPDQGL